MKIENLNFSVRTYNILKRARIDTKEQLEQMSDDELMCVRNLGKHSLDEIHEKLERYTMTNGDRIRAMSDEELGKLLFDFGYEAFRYALKPNLKPIADTQAGWLDWLKQPVEGET